MHIQFNHRMLAYLTLVSVLFVCLSGLTQVKTRTGRLILLGMIAAAICQMTLGIFTLLSVVALPLAVMHQGGAILLFSISIFACHAFK